MFMCFRRSVILPPYRTDICNILHLASSCFSKVSRNDASLSFFHLPLLVCLALSACVFLRGLVIILITVHSVKSKKVITNANKHYFKENARLLTHSILHNLKFRYLLDTKGYSLCKSNRIIS